MEAMANDRLEQELAAMIIEVCNVLDPPALTDPQAPLIGPDSPFGLDSLDAVEIVVAVQKQYGLRIDNQETSRQVLASVRVLADFVRRRQAEQIG